MVAYPGNENNMIIRDTVRRSGDDEEILKFIEDSKQKIVVNSKFIPSCSNHNVARMTSARLKLFGQVSGQHNEAGGGVLT